MSPEISSLPMLLALLIPWLLALTPGVGAGAADQAPGPVWRTECVDCPQTSFMAADHSLAVGTDGQLYVVYAGDQLMVARYDGATWQREALGPAPGIDDTYQSNPALALDATDTPHIVYPDKDNTALIYAATDDQRLAEGSHRRRRRPELRL